MKTMNPMLCHGCGELKQVNPINFECDDCNSVIKEIVESKPSKSQVGGGHYKSMAIQPYEYCERNKLSMLESNVIKYVSRHKAKNGKQDLEKAKHCIDLLIQEYYTDELEGMR